MNKYSRRRRQRKIFLGNFYLNSNVQYLTTVVSAIALAGFVFSGFLLFRFTDEEDLINQGRMQLMEGKVAWAAKTFQTLVTHHRDSYQGHLLLGQAYLQLDERRKAEQEFQLAASLKSKGASDSKGGDHAPEIALSKVAMAQGDFPRSETILYGAWKRNRQDDNIKQALFELYDQWGNTLGQSENKDYAGMVQKYKTALRFARDYQSQQNVEDKLIEALHSYTERLISNHDYAGAIQNLKISLRFRYLPDTLVEIAEMYVRLNRLDDAIDWYRKGFDANQNVGLRLSNILVQKGQQLMEAHKPAEARVYLDEADKISREAKLPMDSLYPVNISHVKIRTETDEATGEFEPIVEFKVSNDSSRDLSFLSVKAEFLSNDQVIATSIQQVASDEQPLLKKDGKSKRSGKTSTTVTLKPDSSLNVHALKGGKMSIHLSVAYRDGNESVWRLKSIQETVVKIATPPSEDEKSDDPAKPV